MDYLSGKTLIVGDGDFSFTVAYARTKKSLGYELVSSTLLSKADLFKLHKRAANNIQLLEALGNVFYLLNTIQVFKL